MQSLQLGSQDFKSERLLTTPPLSVTHLTKVSTSGDINPNSSCCNWGGWSDASLLEVVGAAAATCVQQGEHGRASEKQSHMCWIFIAT
jgi:hypothetical protein